MGDTHNKQSGVVAVPSMKRKGSEAHSTSLTGTFYKLPSFLSQQHRSKYFNSYIHRSQSSYMCNIDATNNNKQLPRFNYQHQNGTDRNLPRQPELVRILSDPEMLMGNGNHRHTGDHELDDALRSRLNLDVYMYLTSQENSDSTEPEHLDKRMPFRRQKGMCKYCRQFHGDHKSWCIYFERVQTPKTPKLRNKIPRAERRKCKKSISTDISIPYGYSDTNEPLDYSTLHRDVYIRALTDTSVSRLLANTEHRVRQTSKPFVFSYFGKLTKRRKASRDFARVDGMCHIFGKENLDSRFETYYKELTLDLITVENAKVVGVN